jgi:hypothetical protein
MILTSCYPWYCALLQRFCEKSRVDWLTFCVVTFSAMNRVVVYHVEMFLQRCVHECYTVLAELTFRHIFTFLSKPLNLVSLYTWSSNFSVAIFETVFKEPKSSHFCLLVWWKNWDIVGKFVINLLVVEFKITCLICLRHHHVVHSFNIFKQHVLGVVFIYLIIVVTWYKSPRYIYRIKGR